MQRRAATPLPGLPIPECPEQTRNERPMRRPDRHTRRMAAAVILGVALVVGGAAYAVHAVASERHGRMQAAAAAAQADLRTARAERAAQWAPSELQTAERATYEALALHRAEEVRLWPIPSADPVVQAWASAQQAARLAARRARDMRAAAANSASAQIEEARVAVSAAGTLASRIHLGPERQLRRCDAGGSAFHLYRQQRRRDVRYRVPVLR